MRYSAILFLALLVPAVSPSRCLADEKDKLIKQQKEELQALRKEELQALRKEVHQLREEIKELRHELRALQQDYEERMWNSIGVQVETGPRPDRALGVVVTEVRKNSLAEKAGILKGDLIQSVGGTEIRTARHFYDTIRSRKAGDYLVIGRLTKAGTSARYKVTLDNPPSNR